MNSSNANMHQHRSFTEAVPLSLSSMAHMSFPLQEGVLDGLKQVLQHTLLSCVNLTRAVYPPHEWSFDDLCTSQYAWKATKGDGSESFVPGQPPKDLPWSLLKLNFKHQYSRNAWIYFRPLAEKHGNISYEDELNNLKNNDWMNNCNHILGRISLLYASPELLTRGELDGTDVEDMPPIILYKVVVEYRSLPATGKQSAVQAEELSMLSFGGSVDDDVKLGALASLYDEHAKYVLEIYSVRGKKYKFDLMDATLSDGSVPQLPATDEHDPFVKNLCVTVTEHTDHLESTTFASVADTANDDSNNDDDVEKDNTTMKEEGNEHKESAKTQDGKSNGKQDEDDKDDDSDKKQEGDSDTQQPSSSSNMKHEEDGGSGSDTQQPGAKRQKTEDGKGGDSTGNSATKKKKKKKSFALTKIHLTLDGNLRKVKRNTDFEDDEGKSMFPKFDYISTEIAKTFILLNPDPPVAVASTPSQQNLLLDKSEAGRVYINGRYVTTWGEDPKIGDHHLALFGMDLRNVPFWHNQITDYDIIKKTYCQLWQEILIDAKLLELNLGSELLQRLTYGVNHYDGRNGETTDSTNNKKGSNPNAVETTSTDGDGYDDGEDLDTSTHNDTMNGVNKSSNGNQIEGTKLQAFATISPDCHFDCLESQILQSVRYDPVGIAAKALATTFRMEYTTQGFPCTACDVDYVHQKLPNMTPIVVPQRVIDVLRRGGYFDINHVSAQLWFTNETSQRSRNSAELQLCIATVQLLNDSQCFPNDAKIKPTQILFVTSFKNTVDNDSDSTIVQKNVCRYDRTTNQYHVNEALLSASFAAYLKNDQIIGSENEKENQIQTEKIRAYLLGMYIAQAHPDGSVLIRYLLRSQGGVVPSLQG